jgi:hypothetical protein
MSIIFCRLISLAEECDRTAGTRDGAAQNGEPLATVASPLPVVSGVPSLSRLRARKHAEQRKVGRSLAGAFHPRRSTLGYTDVSAGRRACA